MFEGIVIPRVALCFTFILDKRVGIGYSKRHCAGHMSGQSMGHHESVSDLFLTKMIAIKYQQLIFNLFRVAFDRTF